VPFAVAGFVVSVSFGVAASAAGFPAAAAIAMSAIVYAGAAQFAAVAVIAQGGSLVAATIAAVLMNGRYIAMGLSIGPSLHGGRLRRALEGQAVVDASWALASRGDGSFDRGLLLGATIPQAVAWIAGTAVGAFGGAALAHPERYGLDAIFPAFYLALLVGELRSPRARVAAAVGGAIALALVPVAPAGVPVIAASAAALIGLAAR
jgi:4-azaleucine resistance transporter AzlC